MSNAPSTQDVANILVYIAPGFFARVGYLARFPQPRRDQFYALVVCVAASVPLVALGKEIADVLGVEPNPTDVAYVAILVVLGIVVGYFVALVRGSERTRSLLHALEIPFEPEATIYEQTVFRIPYESEVTVGLKDGRAVSGYPAIGPEIVEPGEPRELYLTSPRWWDADAGESGRWTADENLEGVIVSLNEVTTVELADDPTYRPPTTPFRERIGAFVARLKPGGKPGLSSAPTKESDSGPPRAAGSASD